MYFVVLLLIALALAIPTFGLSIVVFLVLKGWYDNKSATQILLMASHSAENGGAPYNLYHVNNGAIKLVYKYFGPREGGYSVKPHNDGRRMYDGVISIPGYPGTMQVVIFTNGPESSIDIKARFLE